MITFTIAAEGVSDIRAVERILEICGLQAGTRHNCRGKSTLDSRLAGFLSAAQHSHWIILRDLDNDATCAPEFIAGRSLRVPPRASLRLAIRSVESWLFADREGLSSWLRVKSATIPSNPEAVLNPKQTLVQIAARSSSKLIRQRLAARPEDGAMVGPEYGAALYEFIDQHWDVAGAIHSGISPSLSKAALRIAALGRIP